MRKNVVSPAAEILPGTHKVFTVGGRPIGIYWEPRTTTREMASILPENRQMICLPLESTI
jgi:hypothetical protein